MYKEGSEIGEYRMTEHERGKKGITLKAALIVLQIVGQHICRPLATDR